MVSVRVCIAAIAAVVCGCLAGPAAAVPVELVFFVDYSGSNNTRRLNLAGQMQSFLDALVADAAIDSARMAIMGSEFLQPVLVQDMTDDVSLLEAAIIANLSNNGSGADEDPADSMLAALPSQGNPLGVTYNPNAIKSFVVLTDESDGSLFSVDHYIPLFAASGFLMNVIVPYNANPDPADPFQNTYSCQSGFSRRLGATDYLPRLANPSDAVFSICDFDADPVAFFEGFAEAKITEFREEAGISTVPLPPSAPLMVTGLLALGIAARRRKSA